VETFIAEHQGYSSARQLAAHCWDLAGINRRYEAFLEKWAPQWKELQDRAELADSECFVRRFLLIHEYRKFFFIDPELPSELLPEGWRGHRASELFHTVHNLLADGANRYFDSVFEAPPPRRKQVAKHKAPDEPDDEPVERRPGIWRSVSSVTTA
jgi:phenylacetic acid degradation operon negative regulatory protein